MLGNKRLSEIEKELDERFKAVGIDEQELREQIKKLRPPKRKTPLTVKTILGGADTPTSKPRRRRTATKSH